MKTDFYTLPEISFVGGETQEIVFNLKRKNGRPIDAAGLTMDFALCDFSNKTGRPLLSYQQDIVPDFSGVVSSVKLTIPKEDTARLAGRFVYQLTFLDADGISEIPNQGIMNIIRNIHQDYIIN